MTFSMTGQKKWPFNTGDCLIEVTTWVCMAVLFEKPYHFNGVPTDTCFVIYKYDTLILI